MDPNIPNVETLPSDGINPLLNELVAGRIIDYCADKDLKNVRLVCTLWHQLALARWRRSSTLVVYEDFLNEDGSIAKRNSVLGIGLNKLKALHENDEYNYFHQIESKPYRTYKLQAWNVAAGNDNQAKFWSTFGPFMKDLDLTNTISVCPEGLQEVLCKVSNLEKLSLWDDGFAKTLLELEGGFEAKPRANLPTVKSLSVVMATYRDTDWTLLLSQFPKLKVLSMAVVDLNNNAPDHEWYYHSNHLLDVLLSIGDNRDVKTRPGELNLRSLDISQFAFRIKPAEADVLVSLQLPLEILSITVEDSTTNQEIQSVLMAHSKTLKVLKMVRPMTGRCIIGFPFGIDFKALTELYVWGNVVTNFSFLTSMPNLNVLRINKSEDGTYISSLFIMESFLDSLNAFYNSAIVMRQLQIFELESELEVDMWGKVSTMFPNLKELTTQLNNCTLGAVSRNWPNLRKLTLLDFYGCNISTDGFIGMADLQELTSLIVKPFCSWLPALSDESIYRMMTKIPRVTDLEIRVSSKTTPAASTFLKERVPRVKIVRVLDKETIKALV